MADGSSIEWTEASWNPVTGCSKVSPGCAHCYAEALSIRYAKGWKVPGTPWMPKNAHENVILKPERLDQPLKWKRPRMIFVNSMSDLFHERLTGLPSESAKNERDLARDRGLYARQEDEPPRPDYIAEVFAVMSLATQHTFQVLTKRPKAMAMLLNEPMFWISVNAARMRRLEPVLSGDLEARTPLGRRRSEVYVLPNVWLGTSIENRRFVERAEWLKQTPAAVRFISAEPLLGPLVAPECNCHIPTLEGAGQHYPGCAVFSVTPELELRERPVPVDPPADASFDAANDHAERKAAAGNIPGIDWLIVGGESGPGHRPMRETWVRDLRRAASEAGTAFFMKQMGGARPGGDLEDLPEDLRIREFPTREEAHA